MVMNMTATETLLDQRIRLADALRRKARALGHANLCLAGMAEQEITQRTTNDNEIAALKLKLTQVVNNGFNWPGDHPVDALVGESDALLKASGICADKTTIIQACQALIPLVPASSI